MKILLGNTGRGGEQCIFSAIVAAYKYAYPDAEITIAICPEFMQFWEHDKTISIILLEHEDKHKQYYLDPVGKWYSIAKSKNYDIIEYAAEHGNWHIINPIIKNIWDKLEIKPCDYNNIPRKVLLTPSDEDLKLSEDIKIKYGEDLVIISYKSNSAGPIIPIEWYTEIANQLSKKYPVATTGRGQGTYCGKPISPDTALKGTIDLIGKPILSLYSMSTWLKRFIGPDTATSWIVTNMPGNLMTIRGDKTYPYTNTSLVLNGFRESHNTLEYDATNQQFDIILENCLNFIS